MERVLRDWVLTLESTLTKKIPKAPTGMVFQANDCLGLSKK